MVLITHMKHHPFMTSCPIVKRSEETFVQRVEIGGVLQRVEFKKPIVWIVETESKIVYLHGGKVLKEGSTFNDYYGLYSSIESAKEAVQKHALFYEVTKNSSLEIQVVTSVCLIPAIETEETIQRNKERGANCKIELISVPEEWRKEVVDEAGDTITVPIERVNEVHAITFSTKFQTGSNEEAIRQLKDLYQVEVKSSKKGNTIKSDFI